MNCIARKSDCNTVLRIGAIILMDVVHYTGSEIKINKQIPG